MTLEGKQLDRYHIVRLIGSGGMGDVYLAQDPHIGQQVAIKVIRMEPGFSLEVLNDTTRLFLREARAIVALDHPHILSLFDYGEQVSENDKIVYLVMPYRPEGSLSQWLRRRSNQGLLPPQDVAAMIEQAAEALQHAHDHQVIHQDVKPSNFLLRARKEMPTRPDLLLTDFSIAQLSSATSNVSQAVRGTPTYMAPEQWQGKPVFATDQYALATMAYELLTGHPPFQGTPHQMMYQHLMESPMPPSQANARLPQAVDAVLLRALAKQPQERFPSILAFAEALQRALDVPTGDLQASLAISPEEAERGTTRTITLPTGRTLTVTIPPKVQDGHLIFLAGEGEKNPENGQRGNVLLTVMVNRESKPLPDKDEVERTERAKSGVVGSNVPVLPPTLSVVPISRVGNTSTSLPSSPTLDGTPAPTLPMDTGAVPLRPDSSPTPIPPPPPGYRFPGATFSSPRNMQWLMRIVLGVATLFLLIMSAIVGAGAYQDSTDLHAIKAKQIQQNERATAQAKQTAAALIKLAPGVYPSYLPGKGKPVFADPLGQPGIWDNGKNNDGTGECLFTDGVYRASSTAAKSFYACASHLALSNFAFEVEMTVIEGDCGGALFRADTRSLKSYMFEVCRSGIIALYKYKDNTGKNVATLVARQENNAVHVGLNQSNLLAVVARGSEISLFVNQQLVATVQDKDYTQGDIELFADDFTGPTRVLFKNVKVWAF